MSQNLTDAEILQGEKLTLEIAGQSFEWTAPVRRKARAMVRQIIAIQRDLAALGDIDGILTGADKMLDFFYEHHSGMKRERASLENCGEVEIARAFKEVTDFILDPFVREGILHRVSPTPTPNPEPTKSL